MTENACTSSLNEGQSLGTLPKPLVQVQKRTKEATVKKSNYATRPTYFKFPFFPDKDVEKLLERIQNQLPANDNIAYTFRIKKINWDEVAFGPYTAVQCKDAWCHYQQHAKKFRVLGEILRDIRNRIRKPLNLKMEEEKFRVTNKLDLKSLTKHDDRSKPLVSKSHAKSQRPPKLMKPWNPMKYFAKCYNGTLSPAAAWRTLSQEERQKYVELGKRSAVLYLKEYEDHLNAKSLDELVNTPSSRSNTPRSSGSLSEDSEDDSDDDDDEVNLN